MCNSDHEEGDLTYDGKKSSLSVTTEPDLSSGLIDATASGYHRSASPHIHCIFAEGSTMFNCDVSGMSINHRNVSINNNCSPYLIASNSKQSSQVRIY